MQEFALEAGTTSDSMATHSNSSCAIDSASVIATSCLAAATGNARSTQRHHDSLELAGHALAAAVCSERVVTEVPVSLDPSHQTVSRDSTKRRHLAPVRDVIFDEHGQTWDVYGAEFDPEILGQAIQTHLEKMMKKRMMERITTDDSATPDSSGECLYVSGAETRTTERAIGFFLRYLCSMSGRKTAATSS